MERKKRPEDNSRLTYLLSFLMSSGQESLRKVKRTPFNTIASNRFNFATLQEDILQRIFAIGLTRSWREDGMFEVRVHYDHPIFMDRHDPSRRCPELDTIFNCAMVCKNWSDVIINPTFWDSTLHWDLSPCSLSCALAPEKLPGPWSIGKRWNRLLMEVEVYLPCSAAHILSCVATVMLSAGRGRTRFRVFLPKSKQLQRNVWTAFFALRESLITHCTHLSITSVSRGGQHQIGLLDFVGRKWPILESLCLDSLIGIKGREEHKQALRILYRPAQDSWMDPPFPALKSFAFHGRLRKDRFAREVLNFAPNLERCYIDMRGYESLSVSNVEIFENCYIHRMFLRQERGFRTFLTPYCFYAEKWPGPKSIHETELAWLDQLRIIPLSGLWILVSENRGGRRCSKRMLFRDFIDIENLRAIEIPPPTPLFFSS